MPDPGRRLGAVIEVVMMTKGRARIGHHHEQKIDQHDGADRPRPGRKRRVFLVHAGPRSHGVAAAFRRGWPVLNLLQAAATAQRSRHGVVAKIRVGKQLYASPPPPNGCG